MSFIEISTNNMSRELRNATTFIDNWAYVPGNTKTGDWKVIYPFTTLQDFQDTCGIGSPEGSSTYEYVAGLLNAGIPVLFRRIACTNQDTNSEELGVTKASLTLSHHDEDTDSDINDIKIQEKYGGTFGNDLNITIRNTGIAYWLDVYNKYTLLERKKLINVATDEDAPAINTKLIDALKMTKDNQNQKILVLTTWLYGNKNTNFSICLANNTIKDDIPDVYYNIIKVAVLNARK